MEDYTQEIYPDPLFDEVEEDEEPEEKARRKKWERRYDEYELSKFSYFPPRIAQLVRRHQKVLSKFLNEFENMAEEHEVLSEIDRRGLVLQSREDLDAVAAYVPEAEDVLVAHLRGLEVSSHWGEFSRARAFLKDLKLLRVLRWSARCVAPVTMRVWHRALGETAAFEHGPDVKAFWALKARKERDDPKARAALNARKRAHDGRRKDDPERKEYLASYVRPPRSPEAKAKRAEAARERRRAAKMVGVLDVKEAAE